MENRGDERNFHLSPHLIMGLLVILLGVIFLLGNLDFLDSYQILRYWPVAIIVFGLYIVATAGELPGRFSGVLLALFGFLLLCNNLMYLRFHFWEFWPLLLVWVGFNLVWQSLQGRARTRGPDGDKSNTVSGFGILGGFNRTCYSSDFRGGELTAFMGGGEVDLRKASMESSEAVLTVNAFMGGFKIFVPSDWTVILKVFPLMGGAEDKTIPPQSGPTKNLIIRGIACMGGVEVHN